MLVYRCRESLFESLGRTPTNEDVASSIGVTTDDVDDVTTTEQTFGSNLFQRLAAEQDQTLLAFMSDLARWSRENLG